MIGMPILGEIKRAKEIGKTGGGGNGKFIWAGCLDCGKGRWVRLNNGEPRRARCRSCSKRGANHSNWKGGVKQNKGYVYMYRPGHPRACGKGYVKRAILVLEKKLGRPLFKGMDSHHLNGMKDDDRPENLTELPHDEHGRISATHELVSFNA